MNEAQACLLARIEQFRFDEPGGGETFVGRLARENGWSIAYATRASEEYKRFAFLALVAGHPCTPSDAIDQVWHLHLIHSQQYWQRFCAEVLRAPLHHTPSRGGALEAAKFRACYERTLESYRGAFAAHPPIDLWPKVAERFGARAQRVDRRAFWLVRKLRLRRLEFSPLATATALAALALPGCEWLHAIAPFSFKGPEFLAFFALTWVLCFAIASVLRYAARVRVRRAPAANQASKPDPYESAFLAGGSERMTHALVASMVESKALALQPRSERLTAQSRAAVGAHPLEREIFRYCEVERRGASPRALHKLVRAHSLPYSQKLAQCGLLVPAAQARSWLLIALAAPALGAIKLGVGLAFGKPIGLLVMLALLCTAISLGRFGGGPFRTAAGEAELERLRREAAQASTERQPEKAGLGIPIALAVGLFGVDVLAQTALARLGAALSPPRSSSSDGGGDGGGGGGGGGGGCGGCGGCGG